MFQLMIIAYNDGYLTSWRGKSRKVPAYVDSLYKDAWLLGYDSEYKNTGRNISECLTAWPELPPPVQTDDDPRTYLLYTARASEAVTIF